MEALVDLCQKRLPPEPDKPPPSEVEQEIADLEYRLEQAHRLIGQAVASRRQAFRVFENRTEDHRPEAKAGESSVSQDRVLWFSFGRVLRTLDFLRQ